MHILLVLFILAQLDEANFLSELEAAQKKDREDMTQHFLYLSQDDDRLLQAIQDREGVYRRVEEVEVDIIKVWNCPTTWVQYEQAYSIFRSMSNTFPSAMNRHQKIASCSPLKKCCAGALTAKRTLSFQITF